MGSLLIKANLKPLAIAAVVAAASTAYTGAINAQAPVKSANGIGDMAIVPYYTVKGNYQTGLHIINTSASTHIVKVRFRRASDSMNAMDLNLIMSPHDEWTGSLSDDSGELLLSTGDNTCAVPQETAGQDPGVFAFDGLYGVGAEEGYIEVIAMGTPERQTSLNSSLNGATLEDTAIAQAALHVDGEPRDCDSVRDNFYSSNELVLNGNDLPLEETGNRGPSTTVMNWFDNLNDIGKPSAADLVEIDYSDSDNPLRVTYFVRDAASGLEFGDAAVHIEDFLIEPAMSNQQFGLFAGDLSGFDYPDLNGGMPGGYLPGVAPLGSDREKFDALRSVLGASSVLNDWSTASQRNVSTDWVVTFPGQYAMTDYYLFTISNDTGNFECGEPSAVDDVPECDFRDLPVKMQLKGDGGAIYDREEHQLDKGNGEFSFPNGNRLVNEVNVIEWTDGVNSAVLDSDYRVKIKTAGWDEPFGWAKLAVTADDSRVQRICDWNGNVNFVEVEPGVSLPQQECVTPANSGIPMVGFVAWERSFPSDPSANYGRIIGHASTTD